MANSMRATKCFGVRGLKRTQTWPILSTTTFKIGDFLVPHSDGTLKIFATNNAACSATSGNANRIWGRATEDSHDENGTVKGSVSYIVAEPGTEFEVPVYNATQASAVATPATDPLTSYGMYNVGGVPAINNGDTSAVKAVIKDYNPEDLSTWPAAITAGTVLNPRVWIEFLPAHSNTAVAS